MKFVLFLTMFGLDSPDIYYAVDTGMTATDCETRLQQQQILLEKTFDISDFSLTCVTDFAEEG